MFFLPVLAFSVIIFILFIAGLGYCIYKVNELSDQVQELKLRLCEGVEQSDGTQDIIQQESISINDQELIITSDPGILERFILRAKENRLLKLGMLFILLGF